MIHVTRMTENEILDEIDKLRRENGWKPRRRSSQQPKADGKHEPAHHGPGPGSNHKNESHSSIEKQVSLKSFTEVFLYCSFITVNKSNLQESFLNKKKVLLLSLYYMCNIIVKQF